MRRNASSLYVPEELRALEMMMTRRIGRGDFQWFIFPHRFSEIATNTEAEHTFNVGGESEFFWTTIHLWATDTAGSGNVLESFRIRFHTEQSGRRHESERVPAILYGGAEGNPFYLPAPTLYPRSTAIRVDIINDAAGANTIDVALGGFKVYAQA